MSMRGLRDTDVKYYVAGEKLKGKIVCVDNLGNCVTVSLCLQLLQAFGQTEQWQ